MFDSLFAHLNASPPCTDPSMLQTVIVSTLMRLGFTFSTHSQDILELNVLLQLIVTAGTTFASTPYSAVHAGIEVMCCELERFTNETVHRRPINLTLSKQDYEQCVGQLALCARTAVQLLYDQDDSATYDSVDSESGSERE